MVTDYERRKQEVLEVCVNMESSLEDLRSVEKQADVLDSLRTLQENIKDIKKLVEKVRADRFSLLVAGEAKSGKSTFINAYLGSEILPMDVKQCSSAIVEIRNGKEFSVQVRYADGNEKTIAEDAAAKAFLKDNAALDDAYRDIPVPAINAELARAGCRGKEQGGPISLRENEIADFLQADEIREANIYNLSTKEYEQKIRAYIKEKQRAWQGIVTNIVVTFPLRESLHGVSIVDSPGIGACGGVAEITDKYIEEADAIIFLKPITGQALESSVFKRFLQNPRINRKRETLFLVFTRIADTTAVDLARLKGEAYKQFNTFDRRKILFVDSKAKLYAKEFASVTDIAKKLEEMHRAGTLDKFVAYTFFAQKGVPLAQALEDLANFHTVYEALDQFGRRAHYILMGRLLDLICGLYKKVISDLNSKVAALRKDAKEPDAIRKQIEDVKGKLEVLKEKFYEGVDDIPAEFSGDDGIIRQKAEQAASEFKKIIASISGYEELQKESFRKIDEFFQLKEEIKQGVVEACETKLIKVNDQNLIPADAFKPDFSEEDFAAIYQDLREDAHEIEAYEEGLTFKTKKYRSVYSARKHAEIFKANIASRIGAIKEDLCKYLLDFVEKVISRYRAKLQENIDMKGKEFQELLKLKEDAEKTAKIIEAYSGLSSRIQGQASTAKKLQGGIDKHVQ